MNEPAQNSPAQVLTMQTQEDSNAQQINTLLTIMQSLQPFLLSGRRMLYDDQDPNRPELDGGAAATAVATFAHLCARIDDTLADKKRWAVGDFYTKFQKSVLEVHETQKQFLLAQHESSKQLQRPSFQLKPTLATMTQDGQSYFLAFWGDIEQEGQAIIGRGRTPAEALLDFDAAFHRTPETQIQVVAEVAHVPIEELPKPPGGIILPPSFLDKHHKTHE